MFERVSRQSLAVRAIARRYFRELTSKITKIRRNVETSRPGGLTVKLITFWYFGREGSLALLSAVIKITVNTGETPHARPAVPVQTSAKEISPRAIKTLLNLATTVFSCHPHISGDCIDLYCYLSTILIDNVSELPF